MEELASSLVNHKVNSLLIPRRKNTEMQKDKHFSYSGVFTTNKFLNKEIN